jgi:hypothetical protein
MRVGLLASDHLDVVERAMRRAVDAGAAVEWMRDAPAGEVLRSADLIVALQWSGAPYATALVAMAARKPVVVLETEVTAAWPALDPQTWQPRGPAASAPPIAVSIDLRDEEHSLMLAIRRLASDPRLRATLAAAAHEWWREQATVAHAVASWERVLADAVALAPAGSDRAADGSERARAILDEFGVGVDFLR